MRLGWSPSSSFTSSTVPETGEYCTWTEQVASEVRYVVLNDVRSSLDTLDRTNLI